MIDDATESLIMKDDQGDSTAKSGSQGKYGWRHVTPRFLQFMNKPKWALIVISGVSMNQGIVINGLLHLMVPHIERRFELSSTEASIVINAYDIGSLILLMPITYLGSRKGAHRPRFIGHGAILLGTGSLVFSLPAFITGPYFSEVINNLCQDNPPIVDKEPIPYGWLLYGLLFFGNFLHGVGAVPLSTLSLTYLDDAVPNTKTSLYIGVFYGMAIVGPAIGAGIGGLFSHYLDVDFLRHITIREDIWNITFNTQSALVPLGPQSELLTPDNPRWVGCWWLGFVIFGILFYPLGALVLGFPRILPGTKELIDLKKIKSREDYTATGTIQVPEIKSFKSLPSLLWFVVQNVRFDLITVAGTCELFLLQALGTHFPKLLQQQFNLQPLMVSICLGTVTVPPCLIGLCIGGYIMRAYQLELKATLLFCACLGAVGTVIISGIMLHCPNKDFDGFRREIMRASDSTTDSYLDKPCNENCHCDKTLFDPVCGYNNITYYSACFAGCEKEDKKFYYDCRCISSNLTDSRGFQAKYGPCPRDCYLLYVMLVGVFIYQVISFMAGVPAITASLRCNDQEFRSLALAVQWMCFRLFGAIPGPIVLGNAVDSSCIHWNYAKGVRGSCLVYDHWKLGWLTALTCVTVKFIETVAFTGAFLLEKRRLNKIAVIRSRSVMTDKLSAEPSHVSRPPSQPSPDTELFALTCVTAKFVETVAFLGAFLLEKRRLKKISIVRSQSMLTNKLSARPSRVSQSPSKRKPETE